MSLIGKTADELPVLEKSDLDFAESVILWKNGKFYQTELGFAVSVPISFVYFRGPHDTAPSALWPGTTWTDVSYEEADLCRRVVGNMAGAMFTGTPARLSVSVAAGVPTITIVSGGTGYLSGGSGSINLVISGACTTQMVATATVTSGVLTAISVTTPGAGYTDGALQVYDGVVGHGDLLQRHGHEWKSGSIYNHANDPGSPLNSPVWSSESDTELSATAISANYIAAPKSDGTTGTTRTGAENSGPWIAVTKYRRTA